jgi:outer membrane protein OmpA-like peptidoglycan-associated protein
MKALKTALLATSAVAFSISAAQAEGFYIGVDGGLSVPEFSKIKQDSNKFSFKLKNGFVGDFVAGYAFKNNLRAELDFGYRKYDVKRISNVNIDGDVQSYALTANVLYDFVNSTDFTPFIGIGAGVAHNKMKDKTFDAKKSSTRFAALGTAGVSYNLTEALSASLSYRFFASWDQKTALKADYDMYAHEILLGLKYSFGAPKKVVAAAAPTAYDVAADLPSYMVFFALNSAVITPEAEQTLKKVVEEYKAGRDVKLKLTGHTDLTGPAAFNMTLSKQRAESAKKALVKMGIPADQITTKGVGMADPLIPTALGVLEPQNRRVVFEFTE